MSGKGFLAALRGTVDSAIETAGLAGVVYGIALVSHPAAFVVGGLLVAAAVEFRPRPKP